MSGSRGKDAGNGASGHQAEDVDEAGGTKTRSGKDKKGYPSHPSITGLANSSF